LSAGKDKSGNKVAYTFPPNYLWFRGQTQSKKVKEIGEYIVQEN